MKHNVVVIGAGFAGLSAAACLARKGYRVTVLEKNGMAGGRARFFDEGGFRFDMGPSWYWMPDVFESFFQHFGKSASDYYELIRLDRNWIPTKEGASLYIRPFYFATDEYVGIKESDHYKFVIFSCPVGAYYPEPVGLMVTAKHVRAFPGGTGEAKSAGNYGASLLGAREAKNRGYNNVLWLDGIEHKYIEECGTMNVWFVIDGVAITPMLDGTVLHGTTRMAVIELLKEMGVEVQERKLAVAELWEAYDKGTLQEAFGTGTAATIAHIDRIGHDGTVPGITGGELRFPAIEDRKIGPELLRRLNGIRTGKVEDHRGWVHRL